MHQQIIKFTEKSIILALLSTKYSIKSVLFQNHPLWSCCSSARFFILTWFWNEKKNGNRTHFMSVRWWLFATRDWKTMAEDNEIIMKSLFISPLRMVYFLMKVGWVFLDISLLRTKGANDASPWNQYKTCESFKNLCVLDRSLESYLVLF